MLAGGLAFVGMGVWWMMRGWRMRGRATGTIVATNWGYEGEVLPAVAFTTVQGTEVRFLADDPMGIGSTMTGQLVAVRYDEEDPSDARIATFGRSYVSAIFLILFGAQPLVLFVLALSTFES